MLDIITSHKGKKILWLVPGGSNIAIAAEVSKALPEEIFDNLTVALTDERYGTPGHVDSNYRQLYEAGFQINKEHFTDILESNASFIDTIVSTNLRLQRFFISNEVVIGFFGMGADGHIAGILPDSPTTQEYTAWYAGYDAGNFKRMTLTPFAFSQINIAIVSAFGAEKRKALDMLHTHNVPIEKQPAQIVKQIAKARIYNDYIGD